MTAHVIDLVGVLAVATRTISVRLVLDYLDSTASSSALLSRLFLSDLISIHMYEPVSVNICVYISLYAIYECNLKL